jgi:hypothetical protein
MLSMDVPPKIADAPAKSISLELLPPVAPSPSPSAPPIPDGRPIHALSALILVAVDSLWAIFDWMPPIWIITIPLCFVAVFVPTFLIQKYVKHDSNGRALAFATLLGVLAAIPTPITGTSVGLGVLAWSGLGRLLGRGPKVRSTN